MKQRVLPNCLLSDRSDGQLFSYTQQLHSISVNHSPNPNPHPYIILLSVQRLTKLLFLIRTTRILN